MKYRIDKSDLFINNKLHPEGSEVDLSKEQTKGIEDFLIPVSNPELTEGHPEQSEGSETKNEIKSKSKGNKK